MVYTFTDFDKAKSKAKSKKNCTKGLACGAGCISKTKKCKQKMGAGGGGYADHLSDPANLEKGAESSDPLLDELAPFDEFGVIDPPLGYKEWKLEQEPESNKTSAQKLNPDAPPPTEEQAEIIKSYTGRQFIVMNGVLRGNVKFADPKINKEVKAMTKEAADGLRSLPDYKGETYRGTTLDNSIVDKMKVGGSYSDKGFLSTSADKNVADAFQRGNSDTQTDVLFTINGKHGKDISNVSNLPHEREVLFNPSSKFKITSMKMKDDVLHVGMTQYGKQK